ncbi:hypothetical protein V6N11_059550 [Hibiscus sabdariffa]|uniref:Uncharacterized protein n=1 Tax=Hibiscus sabdariffa TaxID=183260 RepID=A0ABR2NP20_9ROSI
MFSSPPLYVLSEVPTVSPSVPSAPTPTIGLESSLAPILDVGLPAVVQNAPTEPIVVHDAGLNASGTHISEPDLDMQQHHLAPEANLSSSLPSQGNVTPDGSIHAREVGSYGADAHTLNPSSQNDVVINDAQNDAVINDAQNAVVINDAQPIGGYATASASGVSTIGYTSS